jgi:hypothetical protein
MNYFASSLTWGKTRTIPQVAGYLGDGRSYRIDMLGGNSTAELSKYDDQKTDR